MLATNNHIYFISDLHLGAPNFEASKNRETKFIAWLNEIKPKAKEIHIVGDLFDFWFDYNHVVPKGFVRTLGKLAELADSGIDIHYYLGNHDMWLNGYFEREIGAIIHTDNFEFSFKNKHFFVGHGDGKGPGDIKYKLVKKIFRNRFFQWCFKWVHPDIGTAIASYLSKSSRKATGDKDDVFLGEDKEWLVQYVKQKIPKHKANYFIFGHRHLPLEIEIEKNKQYINLGDWIKYYTYAVFDGEKLSLETYHLPAD